MDVTQQPEGGAILQPRVVELLVHLHRVSARRRHIQSDPGAAAAFTTSSSPLWSLAQAARIDIAMPQLESCTKPCNY